MTQQKKSRDGRAASSGLIFSPSLLRFPHPFSLLSLSFLLSSLVQGQLPGTWRPPASRSMAAKMRGGLRPGPGSGGAGAAPPDPGSGGAGVRPGPGGGGARAAARPRRWMCAAGRCSRPRRRSDPTLTAEARGQRGQAAERGSGRGGGGTPTGASYARARPTTVADAPAPAPRRRRVRAYGLHHRWPMIFFHFQINVEFFKLNLLCCIIFLITFDICNLSLNVVT